MLVWKTYFGTAPNPGDVTDFWISGQTFTDDPMCLRGSRTFSGESSGVSLANIDLGAGYGFFGLDPAKASMVLDQSRNIPDTILAEINGRPQGPNPGAAAPEMPVAVGENSDTALTRAEATVLIRKLSAKADDPTFREALGDAVRKFTPGEVPDGPRALSPELGVTADKLARIPPQLLDQAASAIQPELRLLGRSARTKEVNEKTQPRTEVERAVLDLVKRDEDRSAAVEFSAENDAVRAIWKLSIPMEGNSLPEDATLRIKRDFSNLIADGVLLDHVPGAETGPQQFQQVYEVARRKLPVFQGRVVLNYAPERGSLAAMHNSTIRPSRLKVEGKPGKLTEERGREIISTHLGYAPELLVEPKEGIYVPGDEPSHARVAMRFLKKGDKNHPGRYVYVEGDSERVWLDP